MTPLPPSQLAVLEFVAERLEHGQSAPTVREICTRMGYRSTRAAHDVVTALIRKGHLTKTVGRARSLNLPPAAKAGPKTNGGINPTGVPLLGSIAAGLPEASSESLEEYLPFQASYFGIPSRHRAFALRVRGDSMIGRHLLTGDIVVCDADADAHHGDVVAALIDHESTLKTLIHRNGTPWLQAENPAYPELHPVGDLTIQGVVVGVVRCRAA